MNRKIDFAKRIYRHKTLKNIQSKIDMMGLKHDISASDFLTFRVLTTTIIFILILWYFEMGYIIAPIVSFIYYYFLPKFTIDTKLKKRTKILEKDAMYFFEILTLSLESGRNLYNALEITADNIDSELSNEFKYALTEVKYGKNLEEALENMKKRIPSDTINNIILNIRESNIFGNNIVETLYNQIDFIRDKRTMQIKENINKIPMKVSVVSVVFFIPLIMLLIIGPVLVEYLMG